MYVAATTNKYFNFTSDINAYLCSVRKQETLTEEEEYNLFKMYRNYKDNGQGDEKIISEIRDEIILKNQLMIFSCAKEYAKSEDEILDYVNEGNIGLYIAIDKFDPDFISETEDGEIRKKPRFITFAKQYVRREMRQYMDDVKPMVKKSNDKKYKFKIAKIEQDYLVKEHREPTLEELKEELYVRYGIEVKDNRDLYDMEVVSTDMPIMNDEEGESTFGDSEEFSDYTSSYNEYDEECERDMKDNAEYVALMDVLKTLKPKTREIISKYYGIGYDMAYELEALAEEYDMYPEDMQKLICKILTYLKQHVVSEVRKAC